MREHRLNQQLSRFSRNLLFIELGMVIAHTPAELAQATKLLYAVRTSNYDQVQRLAEKGFDGLINCNDPADGNPEKDAEKDHAVHSR